MKDKVKNICLVFFTVLFCTHCSNNINNIVQSTKFHGLKYETLDIKKLKNFRSIENDRIKIIIEEDSLKILYKELDKITQKTNEITAWNYGDYFKTACEETDKYRICEYTRFHPDGKLGEISEAKFPKLKSGEIFCANFSNSNYVYYDSEGNIRSISFFDINEKSFSLPFDKILKNLEREGVNLSCEEEFTRLDRINLSEALRRGYMKEEYYLNIIFSDGALFYNTDYFNQFYSDEAEDLIEVDEGFWYIYDNRNKKVYVLGGNSGILVYNGSEKY